MPAVSNCPLWSEPSVAVAVVVVVVVVIVVVVVVAEVVVVVVVVQVVEEDRLTEVPSLVGALEYCVFMKHRFRPSQKD